MSIDPVGATTTSSVAQTQTATTAQTTKDKKAGMADYNNFLKLLMTELKFQDPTNPADAIQSVTQLATFSALEQQVNTNNKLDALLMSNSISQASSLIGHIITSSDQSVSGKIVAVNINSSGSSAILEDGTAVPLDSGITITQP